MEKNGLIYFLLWIVSICSIACSCDMQIPHGDVARWCARQDTPCSYSCHEGYKEHDTVFWLKCSTSGQWVSWNSYLQVSAKDLCTPKPCPTVISKGAFSATCKAVVGSTCSFSCEAGYMRNTSVSELTCQTSTEWSPDLRSLCLRPDGQQCPYYIPRGDLNLTCIREPDQTCNFTCDEGYQPSISPSTIACGSDLEWNYNPESLCQETICPKLFEGGYVAENCSRKYKATCHEFQCNPGYVKLTLAFYVKCDESGKWIDPYEKSSACIRPDGQQCPYYIPRGDLNLTCIREPGQTCDFTCDKGYQPSIASSTIACGSDLEWNYNPESLCQETICPKLFEGGYVAETCSRKYKAPCYEFQCNPGYVKLTLVFYVSCDESGKWIVPDEKSSACVKMDQLCPLNFPGGNIIWHCNRIPQDVCTYECYPGYLQSSITRLTCQDNRLWNVDTNSLCIQSGNLNVTRSSGERNGDGKVGTIVGITVGALTGILIITFSVR